MPSKLVDDGSFVGGEPVGAPVGGMVPATTGVPTVEKTITQVKNGDGTMTVTTVTTTTNPDGSKTVTEEKSIEPDPESQENGTE